MATTTHGPAMLSWSERARSAGTRRLGGWAGVVGPVAFTASYILHGWARREEYDWVAEPVSALEGGETGWVQQATFVVLGVCMILFTLGLRAALPPTRLGNVTTLVMLWNGGGLFMAALFPLREDAQGVTYDPGGHTVNGFIFFASVWIGLLLASRWLASDPRWRRLSPLVLGAGTACALGFFTMGLLALPDDAPLHPVLGLVQRIVVTTWLATVVVLSIQLLREPRRA